MASSLDTMSPVDRVQRTTTLTIDQIMEKVRIDPETGRIAGLDVIGITTGQDSSRASQTLKRLMAQYPELDTNCVQLRIGGVGRETPTFDTPTAIEIAWLCPGKVAKEFRRQGAATLCRALGGDLSLVDEIERRHAEVAGTETQKQLLEGTGVSLADANGQAMTLKRRREDEWEEVELQRARAEVVRIERENVRLQCETAKMEIELLKSLGTYDDAYGLLISDSLKNQRLMLADGSPAKSRGAAVSRHWFVVNRAQFLGYRVRKGVDARLGQAVARGYERRTGRRPPKKAANHLNEARALIYYTEEECVEFVDDLIRDFMEDEEGV